MSISVFFSLIRLSCIIPDLDGASELPCMFVDTFDFTNNTFVQAMRAFLGYVTHYRFSPPRLHAD